MTSHLAEYLRRFGLQKVSTRQYDLSYPSGTPQGEWYALDIAHAYRNLVPFLCKWSIMPDNL